MNDFVRVVEVGARDGLQNEKTIVPAETKIELIDRLTAAGLPEVEATSFVSPKWIPQLADAEAVLAGIQRKAGVRYPVLVPNEKGLERALDAHMKEIAVFTAASDAFAKRNINATVAESLDRLRPVVRGALDKGLSVRGYVSTVLGCPYQGEVPLGEVVKVARALFDMGCEEISLGDTIGVGTPARAREMLRACASEVPMDRLAVHFHDTYGQAMANVFACLEAGVRVVDSSVGGLGGCPYAKGASGNLATEDLIYMLHGLGMSTGVDLDAVCDTALWISEALGRRPGSKLAAVAAAKKAGS
ncbi:MAG: hydroxymethylglutaryl-CoA lyase [Lautropia sp.]|nr:hydroxymethylglutaryl-CoA lyase [Lautropia sp.]